MSNTTFWQKLTVDWHWQSLILRRALRSAIVVFISVLLYRSLSITQGYWVTLTAMLVVQATVGATLRKGIQRFIGTLLGVSIASLLLILIHNIYVIDALVIFFLFLTYFFNPFSNLVNYGLVVVPLSIMVVFMMALVTPENVNINIVFARFYDTVIGAGLGIAGSLLLFPNKVKREFSHSKIYLHKQLADYFTAIIQMLLNSPGATEQARRKKLLVEQALLANHQFYREHRYEIHFHLTQHPTQSDEIFLQRTENIAQQLFSLHHLARYPLASDLLQFTRPILEKLRDDFSEILTQPTADNSVVQQDLTVLQQQLAAYAKTQDNPSASWLYLAPLADVRFILQAALQETLQLTYLK